MKPTALHSTHVYEVRPRTDRRGVDLISDVLPFGRLWYAEPNSVSNANRAHSLPVVGQMQSVILRELRDFSFSIRNERNEVTALRFSRSAVTLLIYGAGGRIGGSLPMPPPLPGLPPPFGSSFASRSSTSLSCFSFLSCSCSLMRYSFRLGFIPLGLFPLV